MLVVSADNPVRPRALGDRVEIGIDRCLKRSSVPRAVQKRKVQRQMHSRMFVATVEVADAVGLALNFTAQHPIVEFVYHLPEFLNVWERFGAISRKSPPQSLWRRRAVVGVGIDRI